MRWHARMAFLGLATIVATMATPARADKIARDYKVVDLGYDSNLPHSIADSPRIDDSGVVYYYPDTRTVSTNYTLQRVWDSMGRALSNSLVLAGTSTNLLPTALQDPNILLTGLNSDGHVIGSGIVEGPSGFYFNSDSGQREQLKHLGGLATDFVEPLAINALDEIVGNQASKALYYATPTSDPTEIAQLVSANGWSFLSATDINNRGEIVGLAINSEGKETTYLLEPIAVPEPSSFLVVLSVSTFLVMVRSHRAPE